MGETREAKSGRSRPRHSLMAAALALALPAAALAQAPPQELPGAERAPPANATGGCGSGCGNQPQQLPVPPQMQASFVLADVRFNGATLFGPDELRALVADRIGREVDFAALQEIARTVTTHYHRHGYILSQAILPVQEVRDGVVEISVIEGRLGEVSLEFDPATPVPESRIRGMLEPLSSGGALDGQLYERTMLLMSDLPGVAPQSTLQTGRQIGVSDLVVQVAPGDRFRFSAELDNHGTENVGRLRLGGTMRWASPLRRGDNLDVRLLASDDRLLDGEGTIFGRASYEAPLGLKGSRFGTSYSRVSYSLGGDFAILDATGVARIYDVGLLHPVIRQRSQNLYLRAFADRKDLTDELRAVALTTDKRVTGVGLSWSWEKRDGFGGGGYWSSGGVLYAGDLELRDPVSRELDDSIFGRGTDGAFGKLTAQVARLQRLGDTLSLYAGIGAQLASDNLDPSEKLSLGGPRAVRAYPSGEVLVDEGVIANIELRWSMHPAVSGFAFFDIGTGDFNHDPGPFDLDNDRTLRGYGIGASYAGRSGFVANVTLAWRGTGPALTERGDRNPRLFFHLIKSF